MLSDSPSEVDVSPQAVMENARSSAKNNAVNFFVIKTSLTTYCCYIYSLPRKIAVIKPATAVTAVTINAVTGIAPVYEP